LTVRHNRLASYRSLAPYLFPQLPVNSPFRSLDVTKLNGPRVGAILPGKKRWHLVILLLFAMLWQRIHGGLD